MLRHVFLFGVLLPTFITVLVFVGFLVCWFKFNLKQRLLSARLGTKTTKRKRSVCPQDGATVKAQSGSDGGGPTRKSWTGHDDVGSDSECRAAERGCGGSAGHPTGSPSSPDHHRACAKDFACDTLSQCSQDDSEAARLCPSQDHHTTSTSYFNPAVETEEPKSPPARPAYPRDTYCEKQETLGLIHQTFHFPDSQDSLQIGTETNDVDTDEDSNYGYFVLKNKVKQALRDASMSRPGDKVSTTCKPHAHAQNAAPPGESPVTRQPRDQRLCD